MTVYGVIATAVYRKVKALVAEYRKLVAEATAVEEELIAKFEADVKDVLTTAKAEEGRLLAQAEQVIEAGDRRVKEIGSYARAEKDKIKNELINKIAQV